MDWNKLFIFAPIPVSYTHLDVYKRQIPFRLLNISSFHTFYGSVMLQRQLPTSFLRTNMISIGCAAF